MGNRFEVTHDEPLLITSNAGELQVTLAKTDSPDSTGKRGREFHVTANASDGQDTVFHWSVTTPGGDEAISYRRNLIAPGGIAETRFGFALNDPSGTWIFRIREVVSGKTAELHIDYPER